MNKGCASLAEIMPRVPENRAESMFRAEEIFFVRKGREAGLGKVGRLGVSIMISEWPNALRSRRKK